jgi:hypothetical protein
MITMVLMRQASSCLVGVSHTAFDGLQLPSGITKNGRKGHRGGLCLSFRGTTGFRPVPPATYLAFLDHAIEGTGDSLICYLLEKEDVTL